MAQAEQLKQQTLATLSDRDQQLRQLSAMLEEARAHKPKLQQEQVRVGALHHSRSENVFPTRLESLEYHILLSGHRGDGQRTRSPSGAQQPARQPRLHGRAQRAAEEVKSMSKITVFCVFLRQKSHSERLRY